MMSTETTETTTIHQILQLEELTVKTALREEAVEELVVVSLRQLEPDTFACTDEDVRSVSQVELAEV